MRDEISNKTQTSSTGYSISRYNLPENEYYLPQCTPGGLFERVQCSTINSSAPTQSSSTPRPQCWCVDPVTGISNTPPYFGTRNNTVCSNTILNTTVLCEVCCLMHNVMYVHNDVCYSEFSLIRHN